MRYLEARKGRLYFRQVLPADVASVCGQRAVRYRLPVENRRAAGPFAALMSAAIEGIVRDVRLGKVPPDEVRRSFGPALLVARNTAIGLTNAPAIRLRHDPTARTDVAGAVPLLSVAWTDFEEERKASVAQRTLVEIRSVGRRLMASLGPHTPVSAITRPLLVKIRDEWALDPPNRTKGVVTGCIAAGTLVKRVRLVGTFLRWCVEQGWLGRNPAANLALPDEKPQVERRGFTDAELVAALAAIQGDDETHLLARLAMYTGCRLGELTGLRRCDVLRDGDGRYALRLRAHEGRSLKTESSARTVPVPGAIEAELEAWLGRAGEMPFKRSSMVASKRFNRALRRAGLPRELVFHSLRHGVAERLRAVGVSRELIGAILGHASGSVTDVYAGPHGMEHKRVALEMLHYDIGRE